MTALMPGTDSCAFAAESAGAVGSPVSPPIATAVGCGSSTAPSRAELLASCGRAVHLGTLGAGDVAKACNQLVVAATITALGEATVLADRSGIDLDRLWTLLGSGCAGSNLLASRHQQLVASDGSPSGIARYMVKDLRFAAEIAESTGTSPALLPTLRAFFDEIVERGHGERDLVVARRVIAQR